MSRAEKRLSGEIRFRGRIFSVTEDSVLLPNGKTGLREVVRHRGGVGVVAVDSRMRVFLVSQYRYSYREELLEIVAGKKEPGEDPLTAAKRELSEEAGQGAENWKHLTAVYPTPGYCDEVLEIYLATGLYEAAGLPDEDEFLTALRVPLEEAVEMVYSGKIRDAKTQVGLLLAARALSGGAGG